MTESRPQNNHDRVKVTKQPWEIQGHKTTMRYSRSQNNHDRFKATKQTWQIQGYKATMTDSRPQNNHDRSRPQNNNSFKATKQQGQTVTLTVNITYLENFSTSLPNKASPPSGCRDVADFWCLLLRTDLAAHIDTAHWNAGLWVQHHPVYIKTIVGLQLHLGYSIVRLTQDGVYYRLLLQQRQFLHTLKAE